MGKSQEEVKFRSLIKEKLKVTKIPKLILIDKNDISHYFNEYYQYIKFLGTGTFGFVVAAKDLTNDQVLALKVSLFFSILS